jgi:hypothetical protein
MLMIMIIIKVKFLAMARNGLDVAASMVPFFDGHNPNFRHTWGGFPPVSHVPPAQETVLQSV